MLSGFTNRTRAIVLVHPNNPTGSFLKVQEFERVCSYAAEHKCAIIVDEVFGSYAFSPDPHRAAVLGVQSNVPVFSLNGISKLLGLPQLKLSWIVIDDKTQYTSEALNRLDVIADTFLSVNTPVQVGLPKLLSKSIRIKEKIFNRVLANYKSLKKTFKNSNISVFEVEGGWYAVLQFPQISSDDDWASALLSSLNILVYPGHFFDIEQQSCIVISLLPTADLFKDAVLRIRKFVK
jgi:aspartate/methionine/tyrosine aminotransferase